MRSIDDVLSLTEFLQLSLIYSPENLDCNGVVTSVEYCYVAREEDLNENNMDQVVFNLSLLSRYIVPGGGPLSAMAYDVLPILSNPRESICTVNADNRYVCCDTTGLNGAELRSVEDYYGITLTTLASDSIAPLAINAPGVSTSEYIVIFFNLNDSISTGDITRLTNLRYHGVPLLRFLIAGTFKF